MRKRKDVGARIHYFPGQTDYASAAQFSLFQRALLTGQLVITGRLSLLIARAICCDGICTSESLEGFVRGLKNWFADKGSVHVDWILPHGRWDRRILSGISASWLKATATSDQSLNEAIGELNNILRAADLPKLKLPSSVDELLSDASAWCYLNLPGALYAHVVRDVPISALPRSAFARRHSTKALVLSPWANERIESPSAVGLALEAYFSNTETTNSDWFIEKIERKIVGATSGRYGSIKRRWIDSIDAELRHLGEVAANTALTVCWVLDLIESGTARTPDIAPRTAQNYVGAALKRLHRAFADVSVGDLKSDQFSTIYEKMVQEAECVFHANVTGDFAKA